MFVDIPKKLPEGVLEPLITSLLSHAIYRGPVASCLAPSESNHIRGWQNFAFSHIWAMPVWQMEGIKTEEVEPQAISIGPQSSQWLRKKKKRIQKATKELIGFWDMFHVSFQHMAAVRYWSVDLLIPTGALLSSPSDVPGTPGTLPAVPQVIKAVLCAPVVVDIMVHKWEGLLGFLSHLQPHMAPTFLFSHTHSERLLSTAQ